MMNTYEVRVLVKSDNPIGYDDSHSRFVYREIIKMFHKLARTPEQAVKKCRKYGRPLSARKVKTEVMHKNFEELPLLNSVYGVNSPFDNAIAMDEMLWNKRNKRRNNMHKDKTDI